MVDAVCSLSGIATNALTGNNVDRFGTSAFIIPTSATCNPDPGVSMTCTLSGVSYPVLSGVSLDRWASALVVPNTVKCTATASGVLLKSSCTLNNISYPSLSTTLATADRWGAASISVPDGLSCSISDPFTDIISIVIVSACFFAFVKGWSLGNASL